MLKCYRPNCKQECNELKVNYCLFRINEKQFEIYKGIHNKTICPECGDLTIKAKYKGRNIKLCLSCKHGLKKEMIS